MTAERTTFITASCGSRFLLSAGVESESRLGIFRFGAGILGFLGMASLRSRIAGAGGCNPPTRLPVF
jgi:hypothetical protein